MVIKNCIKALLLFSVEFTGRPLISAQLQSIGHCTVPTPIAYDLARSTGPLQLLQQHYRILITVLQCAPDAWHSYGAFRSAQNLGCSEPQINETMQLSRLTAADTMSNRSEVSSIKIRAAKTASSST